MSKHERLSRISSAITVWTLPEQLTNRRSRRWDGVKRFSKSAKSLPPRDLSAWIAGNPVDVLATNFNKPASLFERCPRKERSSRRTDSDSNQGRARTLDSCSEDV